MSPVILGKEITKQSPAAGQQTYIGMDVVVHGCDIGNSTGIELADLGGIVAQLISRTGKDERSAGVHRTQLSNNHRHRLRQNGG
jgi:hypothetical protein